MDWYPLYNSLRISAISTVAVFFLGLLAAYYIARLPRLVKGVLDVVLTLPWFCRPRWSGIFCCVCWVQTAWLAVGFWPTSTRSWS